MKILFIDSAHPSLKKELELKAFICDEDFTSSKQEIENKLSFFDGVILRSRFDIDKKFIDCLTPPMEYGVRPLADSPFSKGDGENPSSIIHQPSSMQYLLNSNKVILTPHIAGWSFESSEKMARILAEKIFSLTSK